MSVENKNVILPLVAKLKPFLISFVILILAMLLFSTIFPSETGNTLDPTTSLAMVIVMFIFGLILKANYSNKLFILTLIIGIFLGSLTTFTQGILTMMAVIFVQKLFKFI